MRVLLLASRIGVAPAHVVLETAAAAWAERAEVDAVPVSDGHGDLCEVMSFYTGAELGTIDGILVPTLVAGDDWIIDVSDSWGEDSSNLGIALREALASSPRRITVNLPVRVFPDVGKAMMAELGVDDTRGLADLLAGTDLVITAASEQPLLGVNGLPRWLDRHGKLPAEDAQRLEIEIGANLPKSARTSLLGDSLDAKAPTAGIGGGASLVLQAAGGRFMWAGELVAHAILPRLAETDLVVYVTGDIGMDLPRSLFTICDRAGETALPALVIYGDGRILRHELGRFGLSGSYSYASEGEGLDALGRAMGPIAQTWAR